MKDSTVYSTIATHILREQLVVIGPLAIDQAKKVAGITVDASNNIRIKDNGKEAVSRLVKQFERLFGAASVQVCKEAVKETQLSLDPGDLPDILR